MKKWNFINEVIIHHNDLVELVYRVRSQIVKYYQDDEELVVLIVMEGGWNFARSLFRTMYDLPKVTQFTIGVKSYDNATESSGIVRIEVGSTERQEEICQAIKHKPVLIVDDIHDQGMTLDTMVDWVENNCIPASVECCVMIEREWGAREASVTPKFIGHHVQMPDFLVGAGLDYEGRYRDLPYVGTLKHNFKGEHRIEHICNKCGELCTSEEEEKAKVSGRVNYYGLLDAVARGQYFSPILEDVTAYKFDLCEKCLKKMFDSFSVPVDKSDYDVWTGEVYQ